MRFLLDTNIISVFLKGDARVFNHFIQHSGGLAVSTNCAGELYSWVYRSKTAHAHGRALDDLLENLHVLPVDHMVARKFGELRAALLDAGRPTPALDLFIACTALVHDLTLVTHNVKDFEYVPGLRMPDWLASA